MKKSILYMIFIALIMSIKSNSQSLANYSAVNNTGLSYTSINTTGHAFDSWRNTASYTQDDNRSDFTDIGFDFWYNGIRYTQFSASTNGFIDFSTSTVTGGGTASFGYSNAAFSTSSAANSTRPAIAPFYDDLTAQGGVSALGNSIKHELTGSAPNRTLTVEWINMAVYGNVSPSLNFQVKLVENKGVVLVNYGTMNQGTFTFSYSMGLNGQTISVIPAAAELKELQTVNSSSFSNTAQNSLSAMPAGNSGYVFTPPVPTGVSGALTFSSITQTGMTLNWPNWASNEVGYVIYSSTDGINYNFLSQTAANATSSAITGLLPSTTYWWKVYAVTEGCLSSPLNGTQATLAGGNKISNQTGSWSNALIWTPNGVPTSSDNVIIANGHTVSVDINAVSNSLQVGQGTATTLTFIGNTARTLTVNKDITVSSLAIFNVNTSSNVTHTTVVNGDIINSGTINFATDAASLCNATFSKSGNQNISGTGAVTKFNLITLNMGTSVNNTLEVTSSNFAVATGFLTLNTGTFKLSTPNAVNITPYSAAAAIPQKGSLWINSALANANIDATLTLFGNVTVTTGTLNIGNIADEDLISNGGFFSITGGNVNIAGKYYATGINNLSKFSISGGTLTVPFIGSTNTTVAPFQIAGEGSQFNMTGGTLLIPREGGTGAQDLGYINTGSIEGSVTGGTLQIGSSVTPASQVITVNTNYPLGSLLVNSANATAIISTNTLSVINGISINTGVFNANNLDISLGANWSNNGGSFIPGNANVLFNSVNPQTVFKSGGETFYNITFNSSGIKTLLSAITAFDVVINTGSTLDANTTNNQVTVKDAFTNNGTFNANRGLVFLNGTTAQSIGGSSITDFYNLTLNNTAGAALTNSENLIGTLTLNNGTFNTNSQVFTMLSTVSNTARIAQITGTGDITGNVNVQRFAPGGYTGWALLGTPISSALTFQDLDDDIGISCPSCPDGTAGGFLSVYSYDESATGSYSAAASYIPISSITDPIVQNKGYWIYLGTSLSSSADITLNAVGTVRKFNNTISLSRTNTGVPSDDGWNLIHNPYPSPISWTSLRGSAANVDNAIYSYNADLNGGTGAHVSYVNGVSSPAVGAGGIGDTIPMWQAFYVHATANTSLSAIEANKVGGNPAFLKLNSTAAVVTSKSLLRLYLDGTNSFHDESVIYMDANATSSFDAGFDALKLAGQDPYAPLIMMNNGINDFQINGIGNITSNYTTPVRVTTGYPGTYTISLDNFNSFPTGACINLLDTYSGATTDLKSSDYIVDLYDTTTVSRFILTITINTLPVTSQIVHPSCSNPSHGSISAAGQSSGPWDYIWKDAGGTVLKSSLHKSTADTLNNLPGGAYSLEIHTVGLCDHKDSVFEVNAVMIPEAGFTVPDTIYISNGGYAQFTNTSLNSGNSTWDFGDNLGFSSMHSPSYNYLTPGMYRVTLVESSISNCLDTASKNIVVTENAVSVKTEINSNSLLLKTTAENEFLLQGTYQEKSPVNVILYDALGKLIKDYGNMSYDKMYLPLNLTSFKPGIYFLNISSANTRTTLKLPVK